MSIRRKQIVKPTDGTKFVLHRSYDGKPFNIQIPLREHWYWGSMGGKAYVSNGIGIVPIKESYEEFCKLRNKAVNEYYRWNI